MSILNGKILSDSTFKSQIHMDHSLVAWFLSLAKLSWSTRRQSTPCLPMLHEKNNLCHAVDCEIGLSATRPCESAMTLHGLIIVCAESPPPFTPCRAGPSSGSPADRSQDLNVLKDAKSNAVIYTSTGSSRWDIWLVTVTILMVEEFMSNPTLKSELWQSLIRNRRGSI